MKQLEFIFTHFKFWLMNYLGWSIAQNIKIYYKYYFPELLLSLILELSVKLFPSNMVLPSVIHDSIIFCPCIFFYIMVLFQNWIPRKFTRDFWDYFWQNWQRPMFPIIPSKIGQIHQVVLLLLHQLRHNSGKCFRKIEYLFR